MLWSVSIMGSADIIWQGLLCQSVSQSISNFFDFDITVPWNGFNPHIISSTADPRNNFTTELKWFFHYKSLIILFIKQVCQSPKTGLKLFFSFELKKNCSPYSKFFCSFKSLHSFVESGSGGQTKQNCVYPFLKYAAQERFNENVNALKS